MNRPEREKPPFNGGSNKSKNDLPPRRSVKNPEEESNPLRNPYALNDNTFRGIRIPWERLISDKRSEEK